jgi:hypothetical protein
MPTTSDHIITEFNGGEKTNPTLKRVISRVRPGRWTLHTYQKRSDEVYPVVRTDVSTADAHAWLEGREHEDRTSQRELTRQLTVSLTAAERRQLLGEMSDRHDTLATKLRAALSRG